MNYRWLYVLILNIFLVSGLLAQSTCTLLIITNKKAKVLFDGELKGFADANIPFKIQCDGGEHYAQVQMEIGGTVLDRGEPVTLEVGKQKILKLLFDEPTALQPVLPISVADLNFLIPGSLAVGVWNNQNPNQQYSYPSHYFAFEKGDEIVIDASMTNKNGSNIIEVATYPAGVVKYSNRSFTQLSNLHIKVEDRSIYRMTFATNHAFDRNCLLKIYRIPATKEAESFNTSVSRQKVFKAVSIVEPTSMFVNSGSNATFSGGKSRILLPVSFPPNTVEWFYRFSASRNQADIDNVRKNFRLFGELTQLLLTSSGVGAVGSKVVAIGVEQLAMPPGANYCDIFLLTYSNIAAFEGKAEHVYVLEGSRQNLMSGNVKVTCCTNEQHYLGIRNPATYDGINVMIEVTAIVVSEDYFMEQLK